MIFAIAALLTAGAVVFTLLVRHRDLPAPEPVSPTAHLDERKKTIYDNLRDLQFEYRMGKLSDQDYAATKAELQQQLAAVLAEIEKTQGKGRPAAGTAAVEAPKDYVCPRCSTRFPQPMKFCGECGQAMPAAS